MSQLQTDRRTLNVHKHYLDTSEDAEEGYVEHPFMEASTPPPTPLRKEQVVNQTRKKEGSIFFYLFCSCLKNTTYVSTFISHPSTCPSFQNSSSASDMVIPALIFHKSVVTIEDCM